MCPQQPAALGETPLETLDRAVKMLAATLRVPPAHVFAADVAQAGLRRKIPRATCRAVPAVLALASAFSEAPFANAPAADHRLKMPVPGRAVPAGAVFDARVETLPLCVRI